VSSHREAPQIAKDPVADNTDTYAFVSPDRPDTVTLITNYIPLEGPAGGPNFYEFGDDVLYQIYVDNDGDAEPDVTYQFRFTTRVRNPNTFLYNTGPIASLDSPNWNRRQFYSITKVTDQGETVLAEGLASPPVNIGPRSTPNYAALAAAAVHHLPSGETVFAGQRDEGFYVDLGSIFDLADLRPFQNLHLIPTPAAPGVDATKGLNVHTIAIQVPKKSLTRDGSQPTSVGDAKSVIGVWGAASRRKVRIRQDEDDEEVVSGPWVQVSRLGNPLFNEVVVPMGKKDLWNSLPPKEDNRFVQFVQQPEVARLLPVLYPGVFPHLAGLTAARADLVAILLTGLPSGIVPGFQNFTGTTQADMLRLNMAVPPAKSPNIFGILGGDLAGFPNGRRVQDDVVSIELRAIAGVTYPLVNPSFTPDGAASAVTDGLTPASNPVSFLGSFPYLGVPNDGFDHPSS
jgi:Domain of unknown function (DUF4331)